MEDTLEYILDQVKDIEDHVANGYAEMRLLELIEYLEKKLEFEYIDITKEVF